MRGDVEGLLERVKAATGPDRELDRAIGEHFGECDYSGPAHHRPLSDWARPYTASIDAALALVERCLPGWVVLIDQYPSSWTVNIAHYKTGYGVWGDDFDATAKTGPLAILSALLHALDNQNEAGRG